MIRKYKLNLELKMKRIKSILFIALLLGAGWRANAQEQEIFNLAKNELKVDVAYILGATLKVEYEHLLNDWSGLGAMAAYNFSGDNFSNMRFQMLGFYRLYFGKQPVSGFFLESNMGITTVNYYQSVHYYPFVGRKTSTAFGIGIALGWKWHIDKSNIVLDIFGGAGRLFNENSVRAYPRMGICIGKRF